MKAAESEACARCLTQSREDAKQNPAGSYFLLRASAPLREKTRHISINGGEQRIGPLHEWSSEKMIRRGVRTLRPTRPAGPVLHLAERPFPIQANGNPTQDGDGLCTLARSAGELSKQDTQRIPARQGTPNTETIVVVPVVRLVVVAVG